MWVTSAWLDNSSYTNAVTKNKFCTIKGTERGFILKLISISQIGYVQVDDIKLCF